MAILNFPEDDTPIVAEFHNLNGDGGRRQLIAALIIISPMTIAAWVVPELRMSDQYCWLAISFTLTLFYGAWDLLEVTVVEHSPKALRITLRGSEHVIPYAHVRKVKESGRFAGGSVTIGSTHSRRITVHLNHHYPFGNSFTFYTRKDYGDFDGLSGPAKLIRKYADVAKYRSETD